MKSIISLGASQSCLILIFCWFIAQAWNSFYWRVVLLLYVLTVTLVLLRKQLGWCGYILLVSLVLFDISISPLHIFLWSPAKNWDYGVTGRLAPYEAPQILYQSTDHVTTK